MCGLAAIWGSSNAGLVRHMLGVQAHRGPDGRGLRALGAEGPVLGHCRLAIVDPDGGEQPLEDGHGGWTLIANGMIYNDAELRAAPWAGPYRTGSDSESILHLLMHGGPAAVAELDGMFAFLLSDGERLIAARDPIGIKPLYFARGADGTLAFASEAKALAGHFATIEEFPAGCVFDSASGLRRYYELPAPTPDPWREADAIAALRDTLERAVVKRLRSDVPFGALLSGGLDSSIIAALAAKHVDRLQTFAVGLEGSADLEAARRVAEHIGAEHRELVLDRAAPTQALPKVLYHLESFDRDLVRSAIPCYFVAALAARHVKVVLTGEGADELFAGYRYYRDIEDADALHDELRRSLSCMHNINLQRVDRMAMAHGLEARVPFLDKEMIALGLSLPAHMKLKPERGRTVEKWILRRAFEDLLPREIVWRGKLQFDEGSGVAGHLQDALDTAPGAADEPVNGARSAEEAHYRALMIRQFQAPDPIVDLVAHWDIRH